MHAVICNEEEVFAPNLILRKAQRFITFLSIIFKLCECPNGARCLSSNHLSLTTCYHVTRQSSVIADEDRDMQFKASFLLI